MYNKKNQKYDILRCFKIGNSQFCRVRFVLTRHEDNFPIEKIQSGDFEDLSLVKKNEENVHVESTLNDNEILSTVEPTVATDEILESYTIIATNPKGEEASVESDNLEAFCEENKLDFEVVTAVLEGKQKTHRKWRFRRA